MGNSIKDLRLRIRSIKSTKKITRAMEMVSAAKLRRSQNAMMAARPFARKLETLLGRLALSPRAQAHPLFEQRGEDSAPPLLILFTSDRGLCGAFNANLIKMAEKYLAAHPDALLYCIGRKGRDYFKRRVGERLIGSSTDLNNRLDGELTNSISSMAKDMFLEGKVREVNMIAAEFVSTATNRPRLSRYLPMAADAFGVSADDAGGSTDYILEPTPERVFEALLPRYLQSKIYLGLAETYTSEHASRMLAMNNATKNCNELQSSLTLKMNKARQASITTQIIEIVSGAEALNG